jgi:glycolate oxidase subunit GlcD
VSNDPNASLRRDLARLVGHESVLEPHAYGPYTHDATIQRGLRGTPDAVVRPPDAQAVVRLVAWCYAHEVPIVPRGGGTGLSGGAVPMQGGVVCGLERLNRVLDVDPGLWRLSLQAGVSTAHVRRLARENGLLFGPDPGAAELSQIGGNLATNAAGPHGFKYGPTGDWVTGLDVVLAPGELVSLGGHLHKDVAGYDVRGLLAGSEGTLGIITAVRLRLCPAPETTLAVAVFLDGLAAGQQTVLELLASGLRPAVLDFLDDAALNVTASTFPGEVPTGARFALLLELDGSDAEVKRQAAELESLLDGGEVLSVQYPSGPDLWRWRASLNGAIAARHGGKVSEDVSVPVEHLARAIESIHALGAELGLPTCAFGHAGDGIVHSTFMLDISREDDLARALAASEAVFAMVLRLDGSITGEHGVGWVKREYLAAQLGPAASEAHRAIKRALDPKGLMNPGKNYPLNAK